MAQMIFIEHLYLETRYQKYEQSMAPALKELISGVKHQYQAASDGSENTEMPNAKRSRRERLGGRQLSCGGIAFNQC